MKLLDSVNSYLSNYWSLFRSRNAYRLVCYESPCGLYSMVMEQSFTRKPRLNQGDTTEKGFYWRYCPFSY